MFSKFFSRTLLFQPRCVRNDLRANGPLWSVGTLEAVSEKGKFGYGSNTPSKRGRYCLLSSPGLDELFFVR